MAYTITFRAPNSSGMVQGYYFCVGHVSCFEDAVNWIKRQTLVAIETKQIHTCAITDIQPFSPCMCED